jgi:hypothetical protein
LAIERQVRDKFAEADRLRHQQVDRARYEAKVAERRYLLVDPANRLVADTLEAQYNEKLRALALAQDHYQRQQAADKKRLGPQKKNNYFLWPRISRMFGVIPRPHPASASACSHCLSKM